MNRIVALSAICAGLMLVGCGEKVEFAPVAGQNVEVPAFEWRVRSREELVQIYRESGMEFEDGDILSGFVGNDGDKKVVYTMAPKTVDDDVACTLGHEVMHLAIGDYHK